MMNWWTSALTWASDAPTTQFEGVLHLDGDSTGVRGGGGDLGQVGGGVESADRGGDHIGVGGVKETRVVGDALGGVALGHGDADGAVR